MSILWWVSFLAIKVAIADGEKAMLNIVNRVLDAFHLTLIIHAVYGYAITGFGSTAALYQISWSVKI